MKTPTDFCDSMIIENDMLHSITSSNAMDKEIVFLIAQICHKYRNPKVVIEKLEELLKS